MASKWKFPEIRVPPAIIHFTGIFHEINHPMLAWGTPMTMETNSTGNGWSIPVKWPNDRRHSPADLVEKRSALPLPGFWNTCFEVETTYDNYDTCFFSMVPVKKYHWPRNAADADLVELGGIHDLKTPWKTTSHGSDIPTGKGPLKYHPISWNTSTTWLIDFPTMWFLYVQS